MESGILNFTTEEFKCHKPMHLGNFVLVTSSEPVNDWPPNDPVEELSFKSFRLVGEVHDDGEGVCC